MGLACRAATLLFRDRRRCGGLVQMSVPPITITFMLACFTSPNPEAVLREAVWNSIAGRRTRQWLLDNGLVDANYKPTSRGDFWVKMSICSAPLPVPAET